MCGVLCVHFKELAFLYNSFFVLYLLTQVLSIVENILGMSEIHQVEKNMFFLFI